MSIVDVISQARRLEGVQELIKNAVSYANKKKVGSGESLREYWDWFDDENKLTLSRAAYRTVTGNDHTIFVLDIDTYPDAELRKLTTKMKLREFQLKGVSQVMEDVYAKDPDFFCYFSGKGGYMLRKIEPAVKKEIFLVKLREMLPYCKEKHDEDKYCEQWHEYTRKLFRWMKVDTDWGEFPMQIAIDLNMITKGGRHVFRLPYSMYTEFEGHLTICSPIVWSEPGKIDFEESLRRTDPIHTSIEDFTIPIEIMDIDQAEGIVVDIKALRKESTRGLPSQFVSLDIPSPEQGLTAQQWGVINKMEQLLTGPPSITPPCIKNAYLHEMPDEHWNRVLFGRYLLHRGYNPAQIGAFIRFKVNDDEDNAPENRHRLDINIHKFITPTSENERIPPRCSKIQNKGGQFYACRPEDATACGRKHMLQSPNVTKRAAAKKKAVKSKNLMPDKNNDDGVYGKFTKVVNTVSEMLDDDTPTLVKKTTRAGLTTSLVVASQQKGKRLLVLEPTNRIAKETFPDAMRIAADPEMYGVEARGAVLTSNPMGCLKLMMKARQLELRKAQSPDWGDGDRVHYKDLPVLLKPSCFTPATEDHGETECEFFWDRFEVNTNDIVIESEIVRLPVITPGNQENDRGEGRCARITVMSNISEYDVLFVTYAKVTATLASDRDTNLVAFSELSDFDIILLDEVSTLLSGQAMSISIAGVKKSKVYLYTNRIRDQFATLITDRRSDLDHMENLIETVLAAFEERIEELKLTFVRGAKRTVVVQNPLTLEQRDSVIRQYAVIQNTVEWYNRDLKLLANFLLTLDEHEWYLTAVTNAYDFTMISMITKPELTLLRRFLRYMQRKGKKIMVTDASLPPMSMQALLRIEGWKEVNLGDPRDTNSLSLVIPDTKKVNITDLELRDSQVENLIDFCEQVIKRHGASDTIIVFPNSQKSYHVAAPLIRERHPDIQITYFRSDLTVGLANERRTMIAVCKPLSPEDSFDWLATHFAIQNNDEDGTTINGISEMLRHFSARQSFYQTIGRVKDPAASEPSVVYCYGIKPKAVRKLIGDFDPPQILRRPDTNLNNRIISGAHWRRTGEILHQSVVASVNYIEKRIRIKAVDLKGMLNQKLFAQLMKNLSMFGIEFDSKTGYLYLHQD